MTAKKQSGTAKPETASKASSTNRVHSKVLGIGSIVLGVVLLAYLAYAVALYFTDLTDGFTHFWTAIFYYPAANVFVPGYLGWFLLSVLPPLLVALCLGKILFYGLKGKKLHTKNLVAIGVVLVAAAIGQYYLPPVANSTVSYYQYISRVDALTKFQDKQSQLQQGAQKPSEEELKAGALQQLVLANVVEQEATKQGVKVSSKEINEFYKSQAERSQGEANLKKQLKELLGWSPQQFKQEIKLRLLQEKLNTKLAGDSSVNKERKAKAEALLKRVSGGEDFAVVAKDSDDPTAAAGGDQGTVKRGESDPAIEAEAFKLQPGQTSGIIKTQQGYVILKVTEKVSADEVKLNMITVRTQSLNEYLPNELKKTKVTVYVHGLIWDKNLYAVQPKNPPKQAQPTATSSAIPAASDTTAPAAQ
ncbi:hypothetical protein EXS54_01995 [Patescibacteria group bacterium]|nr:hypothetical protein [Patescibacteria group bacterium]